MADIDKKTFAQIMAGLGVSFDKELTQQRVSLYYAALKDINADILHRAAVEVIKKLKFFPKASELREMAMVEYNNRKTPMQFYPGLTNNEVKQIEALTTEQKQENARKAMAMIHDIISGKVKVESDSRN